MPQTTNQARTPRREPGIVTSCAKVEDAQVQRRVKGKWDETTRGIQNRGMIRRKWCKQHCRCMIRSRKHPKEVIPEECNRQRASRAQNTRTFKPQVFDVAPPVFSVCVSPMSRPKTRT